MSARMSDYFSNQYKYDTLVDKMNDLCNSYETCEGCLFNDEDYCPLYDAFMMWYDEVRRIRRITDAQEEAEKTFDFILKSA